MTNLHYITFCIASPIAAPPYMGSENLLYYSYTNQKASRAPLLRQALRAVYEMKNECWLNRISEG